MSSLKDGIWLAFSAAALFGIIPFSMFPSNSFKFFRVFLETIGRKTALDILTKAEIDPKKALKALPPLIKGYLRVGAFVGDGAVVDHQFGTTDIFIILPVNAIDPRYRNHFGDRKVSKITTRERLNPTPLIVQKPSLSLH